MGASSEDIRQYIEEVDYPARAQDLLAAARNSDAPEEVVERLGGLPTNDQFSDPDEVTEELENQEGASISRRLGSPPRPNYRAIIAGF